MTTPGPESTQRVRVVTVRPGLVGENTLVGHVTSYKVSWGPEMGDLRMLDGLGS